MRVADDVDAPPLRSRTRRARFGPWAVAATPVQQPHPHNNPFSTAVPSWGRKHSNSE